MRALERRNIQIDDIERLKKFLPPGIAIVDPWGRRYIVDATVKNVFSAGSDGKAGTDDDLTENYNFNDSIGSAKLTESELKLEFYGPVLIPDSFSLHITDPVVKGFLFDDGRDEFINASTVTIHGLKGAYNGKFSEIVIKLDSAPLKASRDKYNIATIDKLEKFEFIKEPILYDENRPLEPIPRNIVIRRVDDNKLFTLSRYRSLSGTIEKCFAESSCYSDLSEFKGFSIGKNITVKGRLVKNQTNADIIKESYIPLVRKLSRYWLVMLAKSNITNTNTSTIFDFEIVLSHSITGLYPNLTIE